MDDFVILTKTIKKLEEWTIHFFKDSRKTQSMFQEIKIQLQYRRNSNFSSSSWERTSANGNR